MLRLKRVIEGLTSIIIGLMLIANSMGELSWRVWLTMLSLWPLLLVVIGLDILGKGARLNAVRVLSSLVILGGVLYVLLLGPTGVLDWTIDWAGAQEFSVSATEGRQVDRAVTRIAVPAASFDVDAGEGLFVASGYFPYQAPTLAEDRSGRSVELELATESEAPLYFLTNNMHADIELGRTASWDLAFDVGAMEADLSLADLELSGLDVQSGVAVLSVELGRPEGREILIRVDTGLADVRIRIPEGAQARVEVDYGIGNVGIPKEWSRSSGERVWESEGYSSARDGYLIVITTGMGVVEVEQY